MYFLSFKQVNIRSIDWGKLIKATQKDVAFREARWAAMQRQKALEEGTTETPEAEESRWQKTWQKTWDGFCHFSRMTRYDMIAQVLAWLYYCHWVIYFPVCSFYYYTFLGNTIRSFIISSVTDGKRQNVVVHADIKNLCSNLLW